MISEIVKLTTMSFPAFSGLFAIRIAAAVAAPDDIPTCNTCAQISTKLTEEQKEL